MTCTLNSMSWLKRRLKKLGLSRRGHEPPKDILKAIIRVSDMMFFVVVHNVVVPAVFIAFS